MINRSSIEIIFFNLCFIALVFSISLDLITTGFSEKIFYLVSYIAIIYTFIHVYKNPGFFYAHKPLFLLCISLVLYAAGKIIWALLFKHTEFIDIQKNYYSGGKRFFLTAFILVYFYQCRTLLNRRILNVSITVIVIGLITTLYLGYLARTPEYPRVKWVTDAATTSAYLAVFISITAIILVHKCYQSSRLSLLLFLAIFLINLALVLVTQTRAAILLTPLLYFIFFLSHYRSVNKKIQVLLFAIITVSAAVALYCSWERLAQIQTDIREYQANNDTSIGARISLWKSGWYSVTFDLLGQNPDQRYHKVEEFVHQFERGNPEAARAAAYHLHNDILDSFSLQGVFGLCALLAFYICSVYFALRKDIISNTSLLFVILPVIVFGITDTVLIQSNTALVIAMSMALSLPGLNKTPTHE